MANMSHPTTFRIRNDDTDLRSELEEELLKLELQHNVGALVHGDIEDAEAFSANPSTKSKQEHSVNLFLLQLQLMIKDTPSMKQKIKEVMTNTENPMGYDLNTTVRKARRIIEIYMLLTASNPLKDNVLLERRERITMQRNGGETLKMSVRRLISDLEESEEEMQIHHKWQPIQKIERIILLLSSEIELTSKLTSMNITGMNLREFERQILQCCQNIMDVARMQKATSKPALTHLPNDSTTMSSNATTVTVDRTEYEALLATSYNSRNRSRSPYRGRPTARVEFRGDRSPPRNERGRERERGGRPRERSRERSGKKGGFQSYTDRRSRSRDRSRDSDRDQRRWW